MVEQVGLDGHEVGAGRVGAWRGRGAGCERRGRDERGGQGEQTKSRGHVRRTLPRSCGACQGYLRSRVRVEGVRLSRTPGVDWRHGHQRDAPHAAVRLVRRPGSRASRAGASLRHELAVRGPPRPGRRAGSARDGGGRRAPRRPRTRARRRAARLRQRLSAPRTRPLRGGLATGDDPVPLPRLDVQPRRRAAQRTQGRPRARVRPGGARSRPRRRRHVGAVRLRQPGPRRRAARGGARRAAVPARRRRSRRRRAALPRTRRVGRVRVQLEGVRRELPRVLPLRRRAPDASRRRSTSRPTATGWRPTAASRRRSARRETAAAASTTRPARSSGASSTCSSRTRSST